MTEPLSACVIDHCITCSDEGVAMHVLRVHADRDLALCAREDGAQMTVEIALLDAVAPGDVLLVHAAVALTRLEATA
jgi:hydrogenase maturation factor